MDILWTGVAAGVPVAQSLPRTQWNLGHTGVTKMGVVESGALHRADGLGV